MTKGKEIKHSLDSPYSRPKSTKPTVIKHSRFGHSLSKSEGRKFNFGTGGRSNKPVSLKQLKLPREYEDKE